MSTLSRMLAPSAPSGLADQVVAALSNLDRSAPQDLSETLNDAEGEPRLTLGPAGLGTSAARAFLADVTQTGTGGPGVAAPGIDRSDIDRSDIDRSGIDQSGIGWAAPIPGVRAPTFVLPNGVRPSALIVPDEENTDDDAVPALFCPGPVRDDPALGDEVNRRLIDWADEVGIYPGEVERLHAANFGRLMMLTHPATDDPDRLLAAARCVLAEWATDDHFLDEESMGADATRIGSRLAVTYAAVDPADLPVGYAAQLDRALSEEPVAVAYRSAFEHLARYATPTQVARLRHELAVMFVAYNQEADWRKSGRTPAVWEYLTHRHENSFLPPMVLVDPIAGYELPAFEFADRRVRRLFALAGTASVILNDLYSMAKESDADFDLPKLLAIEENCSPEEAFGRTVRIHNELMHTFVAEATVISQLGSFALRRFLADIWAWLGGSRQWHATTGRYNAAAIG